MEQPNQQSIQEESRVNRDFQPPKKSLFANKRLYFIVALLAVVLTLGGILLLKTMESSLPPAPSPMPIAQQTPPPTPQQEVLDTSDWQTYRNEEFGFEVKYPKGWYSVWRNESILELSNEQRSAVGTGSENVVMLQLIVAREASLIDLFETLKNAKIGVPYEKDLMIYTKLEDFQIGEVPAVRYKADRTAVPYIGSPIEEEILFRKGTDAFQINFIGFTDSVLNQHKELMNQILSTFRFVEE